MDTVASQRNCTLQVAISSRPMTQECRGRARIYASASALERRYDRYEFPRAAFPAVKSTTEFAGHACKFLPASFFHVRRG